MTLGTVLLFAGACGSAGSGGSGSASAAGSTAGSVSPQADNTAGICRSGGEAARDAVMGMLGRMAGLAKSDEAPSESELVALYKTTFGGLRDSFTSSAAQATNPEFAAVLRQIAAESDKIVVVELSGLESDDPAAVAAYEQARTTLTVGAK